MSLLEVNDLNVSFLQYCGGFRKRRMEALRGMHLSVDAGEVIAVVGSSGSGKSLLAHAILGILPQNARISGEMIYKGEKLNAKRQAEIRGKEIVLVPQSVSYLDPLMKAGAQVRSSVRKGSPIEEQRKAFQRYHLSLDVEKMYPFQLSGGMARRILVSTATVSGAQLIIADEPTPGLEPKIVREALDRFRELADQGASIVLITHDIESVLPVADKVAVFYAGTTVEIAPAADFVGRGERLRHPYSQALWRALPKVDFTPIPGAQPAADDLPSGCLFAPRCRMADAKCRLRQPQPHLVREGMVSCIYAT